MRALAESALRDVLRLTGARLIHVLVRANPETLANRRAARLRQHGAEMHVALGENNLQFQSGVFGEYEHLREAGLFDLVIDTDDGAPPEETAMRLVQAMHAPTRSSS